LAPGLRHSPALLRSWALGKRRLRTRKPRAPTSILSIFLCGHAPYELQRQGGQIVGEAVDISSVAATCPVERMPTGGSLRLMRGINLPGPESNCLCGNGPRNLGDAVMSTTWECLFGEEHGPSSTMDPKEPPKDFMIGTKLCKSQLASSWEPIPADTCNPAEYGKQTRWDRAWALSACVCIPGRSYRYKARSQACFGEGLLKR
jgi:hypothetical protein